MNEEPVVSIKGWKNFNYNFHESYITQLKSVFTHGNYWIQLENNSDNYIRFIMEIAKVFSENIKGFICNKLNKVLPFKVLIKNIIKPNYIIYLGSGNILYKDCKYIFEDTTYFIF
jgi:hypothetical protein